MIIMYENNILYRETPKSIKNNPSGFAPHHDETLVSVFMLCKDKTIASTGGLSYLQ